VHLTQRGLCRHSRKRAAVAAWGGIFARVSSMSAPTEYDTTDQTVQRLESPLITALSCLLFTLRVSLPVHLKHYLKELHAIGRR
jgi:hypothetical protein